ncbi:MAG TPA: cytochrome c biogenesis protein CcsA [Thermoanaerobaculia bacterium]|nr:cytochrome c biogenesis protein CcsA [Thermoanaerobaculia bacterium]
MNDWTQKIGSLKLTVILLVALLVALATGTGIESARGTEVAGQLVYHSMWFRFLLLAIGINTVAALLLRWPFNRFRVGFVITHLALLLILIGALVTAHFGVDGNLALWEGQQGNRFVEQEHGKQVYATLPFTVKLDSFQIDHYPGTQRPSQYRSRLTITDPASGKSFPAVIVMNRPFAYRGYELFQSSYQQAGGRQMSVLAVSHDPGRWIVFLGYFMLLAGMATVLGTRIVQARAIAERERQRAAAPARKNKVKAVEGAVAGASVILLLAGLGFGDRPLCAATAPLPDSQQVDSLRTLPVQHDGRVMPLDTVAREALWEISGSRDGWQGSDSVAVTLGWLYDSNAWAAQPVIEIGGSMVARAVGLAPGTRFASYNQLLSNPRLRDLVNQAAGLLDQDKPLPPLLKAVWKLDSRIGWLHGFLTGSVLRAQPVSSDPVAAWSTPPSTVDSAGALLAWYRQMRSAPPSGYPSQAKMEREVLYNQMNPSRLSWWVLAFATLASLFALRKASRVRDWIALGALVAGVAVMAWGIGMRWAIAGRIPASNMYESMLFLGCGVGLFALIAAPLLRNRLVIFNAAAMSALTMGLVSFLPIDPFIHPVTPVLAGTPWLAIHVPIIMVGYAVLALGLLIAHLQIGIEIFRPAKRPSAERMNELLYWYMHVGSILLAAGIITGSIWASSSWGRYWGWDPKEVWSLIAFVAYMGILHSRFDRQIHAFGVAAGSIVAFWTVLMTYIGVNFVLTAGLHSYGFGSGGVLGWAMLLGLLETVFLVVGYLANRRNNARFGPMLAGGV